MSSTPPTPGPGRPATARPRGLPGWCLPLLLLPALSGCAIGAVQVPPSVRTPALATAAMPPADATSATAAPAPVRASASAAASTTEIVGRRGRMSAREREALLKRVGAQGKADALNRHLLTMGRFGEVDLTAHNQASLLVDGPQTFDAMFKAIEAATQSVVVQSYIIEDAAISHRLAALLTRKAAQGVGVVVLYDDLGSIGQPEAFLEAMRSAGIPTCAYNPISPFKRAGYWGITQRDHRKILVVDRTVGFTGGVNISAVYTSGSFGRARLRTPTDPVRSGWRDTQVRLQGPAAVVLDDVVRRTWADQGCRGSLAPLARPAPPPASAQHLVRIVPSGPGDDGRIYTMLLDAVDTAAHQVYLTMAYFSPGTEMVEALADAARRGVDVRLVLPSLSDFAPVLHAGRSHYDTLLAAGVRLYELDDAVLHAKTAVVDGVVSTVGSSNMDWRSIAVNNELNAVVFGDDFGQAMVAMFQKDVARSTEVTPASWARRPLAQRAKETLARLFERLW